MIDIRHLIEIDLSDRLYNLIDRIFPQPQPEPTKFVFYKVRNGNNYVEGEITKMKKEFGFTSTFEARPVGAAGSDYEHGSAQWSYQAQDADGNDASSDYTVTQDPSNELRASVSHSGTRESTGVLTLRADGDPDADETAPVVGTLDIVVDAPNVTAFELSEVAPTEANPAAAAGGTSTEPTAGTVEAAPENAPTPAAPSPEDAASAEAANAEAPNPFETNAPAAGNSETSPTDLGTGEPDTGNA